MIIDVSKFCVVKNASVGVFEAIKQLNSGDTLYFPKNEYHFFKDYSVHKPYHMTNTDSFVKPEKYFAMLLEGKENITIDGNGSTFVIHGDMCALSLVRCKHTKLKNFTVRYNAPTNIELTVREKKRLKIIYDLPKSTSFYINKRDIVFFEQSPFTKKNYYEYKNNEQCYCNVIHRNDKVFRTNLSPIKAAIKKKRIGDNTIECSYLIPPKFKVGDVVAMSRNYLRDNCGIFFWECSDIESSCLTINYMHGFGWLSQMCENLSFNSIVFKAADGFATTSFADLIHICGCKGKVNIDSCFFEHAHDDAINIHGAFLRLKRIVNSNTAVFEFVHKQQGGYSAFFKGDRVKLYSRIDLSEIEGIYTVKDYKDNIADKTVELEFEEKLPDLKPNLIVCENITYNPQVRISNCDFRSIPTRGILITTSEESEIFGNRFYSIKMPDIFISCDCKDWYESGPCKNLKIHDNIFSKSDAVLIKPICIDNPVDNVHENIDIYSNTEVCNE